jgi:hypothetical protein
VAAQHSINNGQGPVSYILVDYENVQPKNLDAVPSDGWNVAFFLGSKQSLNSVPTTLTNALKKLGPDSGVVEMRHKGDNALDFVVAFYIGVISAKRPGAAFYILSGDTGFDALVEHLKDQNIQARRCGQIADILHFVQADSPFAAPEMSLLEKAIEDLRRRAEKKPSTVEKLQNALRARFKLSQSELLVLINDLKSCGLIQMKRQKVTYLGVLDFQGSASKAA